VAIFFLFLILLLILILFSDSMSSGLEIRNPKSDKSRASAEIRRRRAGAALWRAAEAEGIPKPELRWWTFQDGSAFGNTA